MNVSRFHSMERDGIIPSEIQHDPAVFVLRSSIQNILC